MLLQMRVVREAREDMGALAEEFVSKAIAHLTSVLNSVSGRELAWPCKPALEPACTPNMCASSATQIVEELALQVGRSTDSESYTTCTVFLHL